MDIRKRGLQIRVGREHFLRRLLLRMIDAIIIRPVFFRRVLILTSRKRKKMRTSMKIVVVEMEVRVGLSILTRPQTEHPALHITRRNSLNIIIEKTFKAVHLQLLQEASIHSSCSTSSRKEVDPQPGTSCFSSAKRPSRT
jgi:hypothetical protein